MKKPRPYLTPENYAARAEYADDPHIIRALEELAPEQSGDEEELPPVPDDLRGKWRERFGEVREESAQQEQGTSFFAAFWENLAVSWKQASGFAVAGIVLAIVAMQQFSSPPEKPVMRGGEVTSSPSAVVTIFIASDDIPFETFVSTWSGGLLLEAADEAEAKQLANSQSLTNPWVLNAGSFTVYRLDAGPAGGTRLFEPGEEVDEYDLSLALDDFLGSKQ